MRSSRAVEWIAAAAVAIAATRSRPSGPQRIGMRMKKNSRFLAQPTVWFPIKDSAAALWRRSRPQWHVETRDTVQDLGRGIGYDRHLTSKFPHE